MIDFRYHLVSIIAVFLALAVGLVVGSTALTGKAEQALTAAQRNALSDNAGLRKQRTMLNQEVAASQAFATANAAQLLAGQLAGERVVLVSAPGASGAIATGLTAALTQAGATVTGQVGLTSKFTTTTGQNEAQLTQLAQRLADSAGIPTTTPAASTVPGQQEAAQVLAASVLAGTLSLPAAAAESITTGLSQSGFITVSGGTPGSAPADLAVLITPPAPQPQAASDVLLAVAQELKSAASATVMAGPVTPAGSGNVISAEKSAGTSVSTVDLADTETGQIMVVQALRSLLAGNPPKAYGLSSGAAPSPAPTPATESVPRTAPSVPVKAR